MCGQIVSAAQLLHLFLRIFSGSCHEQALRQLQMFLFSNNFTVAAYWNFQMADIQYRRATSSASDEIITIEFFSSLANFVHFYDVTESSNS